LILEEKEYWYIVLISYVSSNLNKSGWIRQLEGARRSLYIKMSIIDHTLNKYDMIFHAYLDLLPLNLVYFVLENDNFVLEMSWKIIFTMNDDES